MKKITVITPCFNEEENVEVCAEAVRKIFKSKLKNYEYEHIFSDNCSTDQTVKKIKNLCSKSPEIKLLVNSRNVGPFRNMWSAMKYSSGDAVIPFLPADLQDPPEVIQQFIQKWESGSLIVYGVRQNRKENLFIRLARNYYYKLISILSDSEIPKHVGEFLIVDKSVLNSILDLDDEYPYIRGLIAQTGIKSDSVGYDWQKRLKGKSKMTFLKLIDQGINGLVSTTRAPIRIVLLIGFSISIIGFISALGLSSYMILNKNLNENLILYMFLFFIFGINLFILGLIGEYILSIHSQVRKSPKMYITERVNFTNDY